MPRFFFDMADGQIFRDSNGTDLFDVMAAKDETFRVLGQMIPMHKHRMMSGEPFTLTLSDDSRLTLMTVEIVTTLSPALRK